MPTNDTPVVDLQERGASIAPERERRIKRDTAVEVVPAATLAEQVAALTIEVRLVHRLIHYLIVAIIAAIAFFGVAFAQVAL